MENLNESSTTTTNFPPTAAPQVCPTCHSCPTCGRVMPTANWPYPYWYYGGYPVGYLPNQIVYC